MDVYVGTVAWEISRCVYETLSWVYQKLCINKQPTWEYHAILKQGLSLMYTLLIKQLHTPTHADTHTHTYVHTIVTKHVV